MYIVHISELSALNQSRMTGLQFQAYVVVITIGIPEFKHNEGHNLDKRVLYLELIPRDSGNHKFGE